MLVGKSRRRRNGFEGLGRRVPSGSAESEAGPINQVNKVLKIFEDKCNYIYTMLKKNENTVHNNILLF